jgi:hypothetical protein
MRALLLIALLSLPFTYAETLAGWSGVHESSTETVDHEIWQSFLDTYLAKDTFGQTYFAYSKVSRNERGRLTVYVRQLSQIDPLTLNHSEQKAFWINLYNAVTVQMILEAYPIKSIRDIGSSLGGIIPGDPWKLKLVTINDQMLSLDDIEHGIVRPKFSDYRVHFALNCAAMGCPNLSENAFSGENIESLLADAEVSFINHQRGVRIQGGRLIVSKIFDWYQDDFVFDKKELPTFLSTFAEPKLRAQLKAYTGKIKYEYDWSLNEVFENI